MSEVLTPGIILVLVATIAWAWKDPLRKPKKPWLGALLAFVFGPLGLLYYSWKLAVGLLVAVLWVAVKATLYLPETLPPELQYFTLPALAVFAFLDIKRRSKRGSLFDRLLQWRARKFGKTCAKVMLFSFQAMKERYKEAATTYAFLARKTLKTRPHWRQVSQTAFVYELGPSADPSVSLDESDDEQWIRGVIDIDDAMSLWDVIQDVIRTEMYWHSLKNLEAWEREELIDCALSEASKWIHEGIEQ